jgi:hypothetical protein
MASASSQQPSWCFFFLALSQKAAANEARQRASARAAGTYQVSERRVGMQPERLVDLPRAELNTHWQSERASERRSLWPRRSEAINADARALPTHSTVQNRSRGLRNAARACVEGRSWCSVYRVAAHWIIALRFIGCRALRLNSAAGVCYTIPDISKEPRVSAVLGELLMEKVASCCCDKCKNYANLIHIETRRMLFFPWTVLKEVVYSFEDDTC